MGVLINVLGMLLTQVCVCMCVARGQVGEHFAKQEGALASKRAKRARELLGENAACMDAEGYLRMLLESPGAQPLLDFARSKGKLIVQTTTDGVEVSANTGMVITFLIVHTLHRLRNSPISAVPLSVGVYPEKPETLHLAALATGLADLTHLEWSCPRHADPRAACAACTYNDNNLEEREDNHNIETLDGGRHRIRVIDVLVNDNKTTVAMLGCSGQVCTEGAARITAELNRKVIRDGHKCPPIMMQRLQEVRKLHDDAFDAWEKESGTDDRRKVEWALSPQCQKFKVENKPFVGPPGLSADLWDQDEVKAAAVADPLHRHGPDLLGAQPHDHAVRGGRRGRKPAAFSSASGSRSRASSPQPAPSVRAYWRRMPGNGTTPPLPKSRPSSPRTGTVSPPAPMALGRPQSSLHGTTTASSTDM